MNSHRPEASLRRTLKMVDLLEAINDSLKVFEEQAATKAACETHSPREDRPAVAPKRRVVPGCN